MIPGRRRRAGLATLKETGREEKEKKRARGKFLSTAYGNGLRQDDPGTWMWRNRDQEEAIDI